MTPPEDKFENLLRWPLADGRWVFATAKETRVLSVRPGDNSPSPAVLGKHLPLTTTVDQIEQLLDGVIGAYLPDRSSTAPKSVHDYLTMLASNYVVVGGIEKVLAEAIQSAQDSSQPNLADFLRRIYSEEQGHSSLIERDFQNLNVSVSEFSQYINLELAHKLAGLLLEFARCETPQAILGVGYLLETNALMFDMAFLEEIERDLPEVRDAMTFLYTHSAVGSEPEHLASLLAFIAQESKLSQSHIIRSCERAATLLAEVEENADTQLIGGAVNA